MNEAWLVLPLLKRRSSKDVNVLKPVEQHILALVERYAPILLQEVDVTDASVDDRVENVADANAPPASSSANSSVEVVEVVQVVEDMKRGIPGLSQVNVVLAESGFSVSQQAALMRALSASDVESLAKKVASSQDKHSWSRLRDALVGPCDSVLQSRDLPTKHRLFSQEQNHAWYRALTCFLSGPRVQLNHQTLMAMKLLKLNDLVQIYRHAKDAASIERTVASSDTLSLVDHAKLSQLVAQASGQDDLTSIQVSFASQKAVLDVFDVAEIVHAKYGYRSLTSALTDVTAELKELHQSLRQKRLCGTAMSKVQLMTLLEEDGARKIGWLPIRENILKGFRNKRIGVQIRDSMRKTAVRTATLGMAGKTVLQLTYRPTKSRMDDDKIVDLCDFVRSRGMIDPQLHVNDQHYMWFKLPEWMQVEIIEKLASSLEHTPWLHFPFPQIMKVYFDVLFQVCRVVVKEHDVETAYASRAFIYDLVPGLVMSLVFLQLQAIATPITMALPPTPDQSVMCEEILFSMPLVQQPLSFLHSTVDGRICSSNLLNRPQGTNVGLYAMVVPTYRTMGEILVKLATILPSARLYQISNQLVVQTLLTINTDSAVPCGTPQSSSSTTDTLIGQLKQVRGVEVLLRFSYPMDNHALRLKGEKWDRQVQVAVKVKVCHLLELIRFCEEEDRLSVKQIYDFYS